MTKTSFEIGQKVKLNGSLAEVIMVDKKMIGLLGDRGAEMVLLLDETGKAHSVITIGTIGNAVPKTRSVKSLVDV